MVNQFSRTEVLIGKKSLSKLLNSHVAVFGLGGVGGYVVEALVRSGIGAIDIIDNDKVSISNINRQIIATHSTINQYKVDVFENRIKDINPNANIIKHKVFYTSQVASEFDFSKYDYVVDAIDTISGKISLIEECKKTNTPIICAMGAGNKMNPTMFEVADIFKTSVCPLAKIIRYELKKRNIKDVKVVFSKEKPITIEIDAHKESDNNTRVLASNAFCPSVMGLIIAKEVMCDLIK